MEQSIITAVFLPLALAFIMLGMGLTLTLQDFKRIFIAPKAMIIGLSLQLILLPILGFLLVKGFGLSGALAVGVMILAACPGGPTSNLISHLAKADIALSISLTAISSVITVITIPLIINFSIQYFGEQGSVVLPVFQTIGQIMGVTLIPVAVGMWLKQIKAAFATKTEKPFKVASGLFFILIMAAAILKEKSNIVTFFLQTGHITLLLNVYTMAMGLGIARLLSLPLKQQFAISIEGGIQNGTLGIMIAATLLKNSVMTIPIAIYSLLMFITAIVIIAFGNRFIKN